MARSKEEIYEQYFEAAASLISGLIADAYHAAGDGMARHLKLGRDLKNAAAALRKETAATPGQDVRRDGERDADCWGSQNASSGWYTPTNDSSFCAAQPGVTE